MVTGDPIDPGAAALADVKSFLRIAGGDEDALVARMTASAAELCEQFIGRVLLARGFAETLPVNGSWRRLARGPARAITAVEALAPDGSASGLAVDSYAIDIDANGDGWVRVSRAGGAQRVRVSYQAGLASGWAQLPETLRHGVIRLAAHLYAHRDGARGDGPPAAVTALWRPWRRLSVAGAPVRRAG
jgi:uncharacterized phiE125 gp8 family phage protein